METRKFGDSRASYICEIRPERTVDGRTVEYSPHVLDCYRRDLVLHKEGSGPFCRFRIPANLPVEGVYILTMNGSPCYVGECVHLSKRFNMGYGQISPRNCFVGGQSTNCRVNRRIFQASDRGDKIELWFVKTDTRKSLELSLITSLKPEWNNQHRL